MVQAASATEEVLQALKTGKTYGVYNKKPQNIRQAPPTSTGKRHENILKEVITKDQQLMLNLWQKADTIRLIGQNGIVKDEAYHTSALTYTFMPADTYIRAEIMTPETDFYLNPVLRYDGQYPPENYKVATTDVWLTFLWRYAIVVIDFLCICLFFKRDIRTMLHGQLSPLPQSNLGKAQVILFERH